MQSQDTAAHPATITMTPAAIEKVRALLVERNLPGHALRVFVSGSGCSGLQYGMGLESNPRQDDQRFTFDGLDLVIDPVSLGYMAGASVDYVEGPMGSGFRIDNPNAISGCGCGQTSSSSGCQGGCGCG